MNELQFVTPSDLIQKLTELHQLRMKSKSQRKRGKPLSKSERLKVLQKTDSKCHVCGCQLEPDHFEADHVMAHAKGGSSHIDNFLPACKICNNYRWDYLSEEFQLILKIGVWARTQVEKKSKIGLDIAKGFVGHERSRVRRRKAPR